MGKNSLLSVRFELAGSDDNDDVGDGGDCNTRNRSAWGNDTIMYIDCVCIPRRALYVITNEEVKEEKKKKQ